MCAQSFIVCARLTVWRTCTQIKEDIGPRVEVQKQKQDGVARRVRSSVVSGKWQRRVQVEER